jgi:hypothetical protein
MICFLSDIRGLVKTEDESVSYLPKLKLTEIGDVS